MLQLVRQRVHTQLVRNRGSESHLDRLFRYADPGNPNVLTVGFGRRFATYKRSTLLFKDLDALRQIVCNPERPVLFIFTGKAHPDDHPGQDLIRHIMQVAKMPEFVGHLLLVEGYDLRLARRLVAGVDVWLNNPIHPLEASGTSGMKAAMNGGINLSVLDGWWDEGYDGTNGWAIKPASDRIEQAARDLDEAHTLYEILQDHMLPLYYAREGLTHSPGWVRMAKRAMTTILPRFNAERMLTDYLTKFYGPAAQRGRAYQDAQCATAGEIARWKERVRAAWPSVSIRHAGRAGASHCIRRKRARRGRRQSERSRREGRHGRARSGSGARRGRRRRAADIADPRRIPAHRWHGALCARSRAGHVRQARRQDSRLSLPPAAHASFRARPDDLGLGSLSLRWHTERGAHDNPGKVRTAASARTRTRLPARPVHGWRTIRSR